VWMSAITSATDRGNRRRPRLVRLRFAPKAHPEFVQQPAVGQHVEGRVGCFHIDRAEVCRPVLTHRHRGRRAQRLILEAIGPGFRPQWRLAYTEPETISALARGQLEAHLDRSAGSRAGPHLAGKGACASSRQERAATPLRSQEFSPIAAYGASRLIHVEESSPVAKLRVVGCARKSAPLFGSISVITCMVDFGRRSPSTHSTYPVARAGGIGPTHCAL